MFSYAGGLYSTASIVVSTYSAPHSGLFSISPSQGSAISDHFTLATYLWQDENLPLSYEFGFLTSIGLFQTIRAASEETSGSFLLPAGQDFSNYNLTCEAIIYNSVYMNTTVQSVVRVLPSVQLSDPIAIQAFTITSIANSDGNQNLIQQTLAYGSSLLNTV